MHVNNVQKYGRLIASFLCCSQLAVTSTLALSSTLACVTPLYSLDHRALPEQHHLRYHYFHKQRSKEIHNTTHDEEVAYR
jgi:beta-lactamase class D